MALYTDIYKFDPIQIPNTNTILLVPNGSSEINWNYNSAIVNVGTYKMELEYDLTWGNPQALPRANATCIWWYLPIQIFKQNLLFGHNSSVDYMVVPEGSDGTMSFQVDSSMGQCKISNLVIKMSYMAIAPQGSDYAIAGVPTNQAVYAQQNSTTQDVTYGVWNALSFDNANPDAAIQTDKFGMWPGGPTPTSTNAVAVMPGWYEVVLTFTVVDDTPATKFFDFKCIDGKQWSVVSTTKGEVKSSFIKYYNLGQAITWYTAPRVESQTIVNITMSIRLIQIANNLFLK